MNEKHAWRNFRLYKWHIALGEPLFWGPILISALQNLGQMSLSQIYLMESVVILGLVLLEVPSGALADLIGRKKAIFIGHVLHTISTILFATMSNLFDAWCANIVWVIGYSLYSGADEALLYDSLKEIGRTDLFREIHGKAVGSRLFLIAFCSIAAGFLAEINLRLPVLLSIIPMIVSAAIALFFTEPQLCKKYSVREQFSLVKISTLFVANHKAIKWIIGFTILIGVSSKLWFFTYNPYFELIKLDYKYYGLIFFGLNMVSWIFSHNADLIVKKISEAKTIILMFVIVGMGVFLMGTFVSIFSISMIFAVNIVRGISSPFTSEFLNRHLDSENRATVLSIKSASNGLAQFLGMGFFGFLLQKFDLVVCMQILGICVIFFGLLIIRKYYKIFG